MYTIDWTAVIAVALIALVVVFIRISWTLKEICDAVSAGGQPAAKPALSVSTAVSAAKSEARAAKIDEVDDTEIAAVIAIASQAMRAS
jgi:type II secretory pathway component PulC